MKLKENSKAWLGLNKQDTIINISALPFIIGFFSSNLNLIILLFLITVILNIIGLIIYFTNKSKASKKVADINKWISVLVILALWILMYIRLRFIL